MKNRQAKRIHASTMQEGMSRIKNSTELNNLKDIRRKLLQKDRSNQDTQQISNDFKELSKDRELKLVVGNKSPTQIRKMQLSTICYQD